MKYLVMECHDSYSVVLDNEGRFLKVANMNYQIGQTVEDVFEMIEPGNIVAFPAKKVNQSKSKSIFGRTFGLVALAASMIFIFTSLFNMNNVAVGSIYMKINPEVRLDINRKNIVVDADGVNGDGKDLLEGYSHEGKHMDTVVDELVELSIDKGYLFDQGKISIKVDADDENWVTKTSGHLDTHLKQLLSDNVTIKINYSDTDYQNNDDDIKSEEENNTQIKIPVKKDDMTDYDDINYNQNTNVISPEKPTTNPKPVPIDDSGYDDSGYDDSGYDDSGYAAPKPTPTPIDDSGYDDSGYTAPRPTPIDGSGYDESNYETPENTDSNYSDSAYGVDTDDDSKYDD